VPFAATQPPGLPITQFVVDDPAMSLLVGFLRVHRHNLLLPSLMPSTPTTK
jgi:hypothetical protein